MRFLLVRFMGHWNFFWRLVNFLRFWVGHVLCAISSISELETVTTQRIHSILEFDALFFFRVICNILDVLCHSSILELEMKLYDRCPAHEHNQWKKEREEEGK